MIPSLTVLILSIWVNLIETAIVDHLSKLFYKSAIWRSKWKISTQPIRVCPKIDFADPSTLTPSELLKVFYAFSSSPPPPVSKIVSLGRVLFWESMVRVQGGLGQCGIDSHEWLTFVRYIVMLQKNYWGEMVSQLIQEWIQWSLGT